MPDPETMLRAIAERFGWTIHEEPPIPNGYPSKDGYLELRAGERVTLRASIPHEPALGYDPWDALYQACALATFPLEELA